MLNELGQVRHAMQGVVRASKQLKELLPQKESTVGVPDNIALHKADLKLEKSQYGNLIHIGTWVDKLAEVVESVLDKLEAIEEFVYGPKANSTPVNAEVS